MGFKAPIPIFVIVRDRLTVLKQAVKSYIHLIGDPVKIVFIENGSTYPPAIKFFEKAQSKKIDVIWNHPGQKDSRNFCNGFDQFISKYINQMDPRPPYYCVTDPDIVFENIPEDILRLYVHLLEDKKVTCVGPALRIDDIPDHYPLKNLVLKKHQGYWKSPIEEIDHNGFKIKFKHCPIDTTFAIYRSNFLFKRHNPNAIRVFEPYWARHLDWYINPQAMPKDQIHYLQTSHSHFGISHWCGQRLKQKIANGAKTKR